jgi:hypothetical protein
MKPQPRPFVGEGRHATYEWGGGLYALQMYPGNSGILNHCPYGGPGDLLWCKEAWQVWAEFDALSPSEIPPGSDVLHYSDRPHFPWGSRKRHARYMPRWASRLTLELTEVRVQRLNDISEEDAIAEGFQAGWLGDSIPETDIGGGCTISSPGTYASAAGHFQILWCELHGDDSWDEDPFVWCLSFTVHRQKIDELLRQRSAA